jgi:glutamate dehydrogenase
MAVPAQPVPAQPVPAQPVPAQPVLSQTDVAGPAWPQALVAAAADTTDAIDSSAYAGLATSYYLGVFEGELEDRSPTDLVGAVVSHWALARKRSRGEIAVRCFNPTVEVDGWSIANTVIDVVTDDMAFIVDSVTMAVRAAGLTSRIVAHPILHVTRSFDGQMASVDAWTEGLDAHAPGSIPESLVHIEVEQIADPAARALLGASIEAVLGDVAAVDRDQPAMSDRALELAMGCSVELDADGTADADAAETAAYLRWLSDDRFVFLGYRKNEYDEGAGQQTRVIGSGLGIQAASDSAPRDLGNLAPAFRHELTRTDRRLILTTANRRSRVLRDVPMDYVGVKEFGADGKLIAEHRFLGIYSSAFQRESATQIPVIRRKVESVLAASGYPSTSHGFRQIRALLEEYPRRELAQIEVSDLGPIVRRMVALGERRTVALYYRRDPFGRYYSCFVNVPRDRYNTEVRERLLAVLLDGLRGVECEWVVQIGSDALARLQVFVQLDANRTGAEKTPDFAEIERQLNIASRSWSDGLRVALINELGPVIGSDTFVAWRPGISASYEAVTDTDTAIADLRTLTSLGDGELSLDLQSTGDEWRCRLHHRGGQIELSTIVPILQDLGSIVTEQRPFALYSRFAGSCWIHDLGLRLTGVAPPHTSDPNRSERFEEAFIAAFTGRCESDRLASLVMRAGLTWREVALLRAYRRYQRQIGTTFTDRYVHEVLERHPIAAAGLVELFHAGLAPGTHSSRERADHVAAVTDRLDVYLDLVVSLDEDRILRSFLGLVAGTVRTNFHEDDSVGSERALSLKLDPSEIEGLPNPKPAREIWVYSPRVEGVHLRTAAVARGGIRWSERRDDFRTEVLGLMKAQAVKNAVIVPSGAKGGFVSSRLAGGADVNVPEEVEACYRLFINGLLDVVDDVSDGKVVSRPGQVRCDGDDSYLVVAADKGTARLSDVANEIATSRGFWLGDAFASGGSNGYDHKGMGITAKGAWVSGRRHFEEMGASLDDDPISAVGIGDMSGDVFGNGMLLSRHLRVIAAFDHRHIFIDPTPEPAATYAERQRLFALGASSWDDFDRSALSVGGAIHERKSKSIALSAEAQLALGVEQEVFTPEQLISAILLAPVDLIWNGGIGTYIKASHETHAECGDRANDLVRVDAADLRSRAVIEGGNLGLTQAARIEYAMNGGRINTDAVDNSAGVDCSDHEVNIKILLAGLVAEGVIDAAARDSLLVDMTDDVSEAVLEHNHGQALALSLARRSAGDMIEVHRRQIAWLGELAGLDRAIEELPDQGDLDDRRRLGLSLTQPELAVVMAYTKNLLVSEVVATDVPEEFSLDGDLTAYFPQPLLDRFPQAVAAHPLRREILAVRLVNRLVNRAGLSIWMRVADETSAPLAEVVRATAAAWKMFHLDEYWDRVVALNGVSIDTRAELLAEVKRLGERASRWLLQNRNLPITIDEVVSEFEPVIFQVTNMLPGLLSGLDETDRAAEISRMTAEHVNNELAGTIAGMGLMVSSMDIGEIANSTGHPIAEVAAIYFRIDDELDLAWVRNHIIELSRSTRWDSLARTALRDDFYRAQRDLAEQVLLSADGSDSDCDALISWSTNNAAALGRYQRFIADISAADESDFAHVSVVVRELRNLVRLTV